MILEIAEYLGIITFSASGFYIGKRNNLDILGIYIVAFLTALGGGIARDVIIARAPISLTLTSPALIVITITTLLLILRHYQDDTIDTKPLFVLVDAIGMVSFAISGAMVTLHNTEFNLAGVVSMAFITAVGGGVSRDILINQVPYVLKGGFYGIIAIAIGVAIYLLDMLGILNAVSVVVIFVSAVMLRMYAYRSRWSLPRGV